MKLFILFLVPFLLFTQPHAQNLFTFKKCMSTSSTPLYFSSSPSFKTQISKSFVNLITSTSSPLVVSIPKNEAQAIQTVNCAIKSSLKICPRSGGHSYISNSLCNGIVLDLSSLRRINVNPTTVTFGSGVTLGELLYNVRMSPHKRWMNAGLCPSVGVGGFIQGGGHGPYDSKFGLSCDAMVSARVIDGTGKLRIVNKSNNKDLFWAICGAGGGQFGVVTQFTLKTKSSSFFDKAVGFRFKWPIARAAPILARWANGNFENIGNIWTRMEFGLASDPHLYMYGACYNTMSTSMCMSRLKSTSFFNRFSNERTTVFLQSMKSSLHTHAFFGPSGGWANQAVPDNEIPGAFLGQRFSEAGNGNGIYHHGPMLRTKGFGKWFWQNVVNVCQSPGGSFSWLVCQFNLVAGRMKTNSNGSFAHRNADVIAQFIIPGGREQDRKRTYYKMKGVTKKFTLGVYVNYPTVLLTKKEYPSLYWGGNLNSLRWIKKKYDPSKVFLHKQPII